jgi:hypothetical protein
VFVLPIATFGCARGAADRSEPAPDAAHPVDATKDGSQVTVDAPPDAGCAISAGLTPTLDGSDDLSEYPAAQLLTPAAMLGSDAAAIAWNKSKLFVTVTSGAFTAPYEPLHVYVEPTTALAAAIPTSGKEYGGLIATVPFAATHLIALRRVSDSGTGGYNGVFLASDGWATRSEPLDAIVSGDQRTVSIAVPWTVLGGCPTALRLALHVVHGQTGNEWKDLVPSTHAPWLASGGGYYEIDLTAPPAVAGWSLR